MNGPDALAICEQGLCDIVLLDVMMPGMDGFEVCRRLKNDPAHRPPPGGDGHRPRPARATACAGLDAGADDFLTKPIDDTALFARVRSLVRLKAVTDELRSRAMASRDFGMGDPFAGGGRGDRPQRQAPDRRRPARARPSASPPRSGSTTASRSSATRTRPC